jgi:hypothetical protein
MAGGAINDADKLKTAIRRKRKHYPPLDEPFVLAVLSMSSFAGARAFEEALVGSHAIEFAQNAPGRSKSVRLRDGVFVASEHGSGIAAVLTASQLPRGELLQHCRFCG